MNWTNEVLLHISGNAGGLNGSTQHFLEVYSQESENLKFVVGVDLSAALLGSDLTGNSRLGLCSSGSIVVRARLCFRSSRVARAAGPDRISQLHHRRGSTAVHRTHHSLQQKTQSAESSGDNLRP